MAVPLVLALLLTACEGLSPGDGTLRDVLPISSTVPGADGGPESTAGSVSSQPATSVTASPTTSRVPTTGTPSTAAPPVETTASSPVESTLGSGAEQEEEEDGLARPGLWMVVGGLVVLLFLAGWAAGRIRRPQAPPAPGPTTWREHLGVGYEEVRWLQAVVTDDYAVGMATPDEPMTTPPAESPGHPDRRQVEGHARKARESLRRAREAAPDATASRLIGAVEDALDGLEQAVEARAMAHVDAMAQPADAGVLERERIEVTRLAERRAELESALAPIRSLL